MTDVDFVQWGPQRDYSDVKITTTHASTEGDETRWVVVGETASWGSPRPVLREVHERGGVACTMLEENSCFEKSRR